MEEYSVVIEDLTVYYPITDVTALNNVTLRIRCGEAVLVLGRTGAGKTTLLLALSKIIPLYVGAKISGRIIINGIDVRDESPENLARYISLVMQEPSSQIVSLTVFDEVSFGPMNLGFPVQQIKKNVNYALKVTRLNGLEDRNPRELSGGQQQSVIIASILAMGSNVISMDEPISMLDPIGKTMILNAVKELKKEGKTIIMTESGSDLEYILNEGFIDRIVLLDEGKVVADGSPYEILSRKGLLESCGITSPQVTQLYFRIRDRVRGWDRPPITIDEVLKIAEAFKFRAPKKVFMRPFEGGDIIVHASNIHYTYPNGVVALRGASIDVFRGTFHAIIGQNGSGKSTLAKSLVGLYKPSNTDAEVIVDGVNVKTAPLEEVVKIANYVFQNPGDQLFCDTVKEELLYGPITLGMSEDWIEKRLKKVAELFGLGEMLDEYIMGLTQGEKRRVATASIAMLKPRVMIVDEITGGLDMVESRRLLNALLRLKHEERTTVVFITHDMRIVAEYADIVSVMNNGKVIMTGTPREVFGREIETLKKLSLLPPQTAILSYELNKRHPEVPRGLLFLDELVECVV